MITETCRKRGRCQASPTHLSSCSDCLRMLKDACHGINSALHKLGICKTEVVKMVPCLWELMFLVQDGKYANFDLFSADAWNVLRRILRPEWNEEDKGALIVDMGHAPRKEWQPASHVCYFKNYNCLCFRNH